MNQLAIGCVPAMGELRETGPLEFGPGEMQQGPTLPIEAGTGHTGCIDQGCSVAVAQQVLSHAGTTLEVVMHVPKDHKISRSIPPHAIQGEGQILIPPVDRGCFPVSTTGTGRIGPQSRGTAVRHHDQRLVGRDSCRSLNDPIGGLFQRHRSIDRLHSLGEVKTTTGTAGACTHDRQREIRPLDDPPGAMEITQHSNLLLEDPTTAVPAAVMVPQDHRHRERKPRNSARQTQVPVGEIANKQNSVWLEQLQKLLVRIAPGTMQVTGNGKSQVLQSECLGWSHPAPNWS